MAVVVPLNQLSGDTGDTSIFDRLRAVVRDDLGRVDAVITEQMRSPVALIPDLVGHIVAAGGKRVRPTLTLATAQLFGYEGDRHVGLAACVEFIHTATLLHDDVVDDSTKRRGLDAANAIWGNAASVLVGDFLFSRAFQLMVEDGCPKALRILSTAAAVIAEGEVRQLVTTRNIEITETVYLDVIKAKTARLFAAACQVGALVAECTPSEEQALESYGLNLGIAYQLVDDVLDYTAQSGDLGKNPGDDFREGKISLPVLLAYRRGNAVERDFWRRTLVRLEQRPGDFDQAVELLKRRDALVDGLDRARHYAAISEDALAFLPQSDIRDLMIRLARFCPERTH